MMRKGLGLLAAAVLLLVSCSSERYELTMRFPYLWQGTPGFGGNIDQYGFPEPSGLCFHPQRKTIFVVDDNGILGEITKDGVPVFTATVPGDLEAVTVDPATGYLYIVAEGEDVIIEFDPERRTALRRFPVNREFDGNPNFLELQEEEYDNGIEAIAFVPDEDHPEGGTFYLGNQWDPPCIVEAVVPLRSSGEEGGEARIIRLLPLVIDDPADMYYDYETKRLNIIDDADNILVEVTLKGKIVKEYAFLGNDQEGLCKDDEGFVYYCQDIGEIIKVKDLR